MELRTQQIALEDDARISQAMQAIPLPAGLRERVLARLDGEPIIRPRRRWAAWGAGVAAAAALLLATRFWWPRGSADRTLVQGAAVLAEEAAKTRVPAVQSPWPRNLSRTPEAVTAQAQRRFQLDAAAPGRLPLRQLVGMSTATLGGRQVAVLHYQLPRGPAAPLADVAVYVLPTAQFRVKNVGEPSVQFETGGVAVTVWSESQFVYVGVHSGPADDWQRFLQPPARPIA
jgi:hypothetical protein